MMGFDQVGPFALLNRFRDDWIVSKRAVTLFLVSVPWILALTFLFGWVDFTKPTIWMNIVGGVIGVAGPIALFFLWLGMWRYWVRLDRSTPAKKRIWFAILLVGFWYGSILYYFFVYRPQVLGRIGAET
jgi:hypothetical protein